MRFMVKRKTNPVDSDAWHLELKEIGKTKQEDTASSAFKK